jgi:hypothetical protein
MQMVAEFGRQLPPSPVDCDPHTGYDGASREV